MKRFQLYPISRTHGVLSDDCGVSPARFLTLREAKFEAAFRGIQQSEHHGSERR